MWPIVGHRFELDMGQWGKQACEVLQVEQERLLKYRFAANILNTVITWELIPEGSGTRLKLTHEGFNLNSPMGRKALEGMKPGWPQVLARLETKLGMFACTKSAEEPSAASLLTLIENAISALE